MIEKRTKTLGTAATPSEKAAFESFCASQGYKPSELIRLLISKVCPAIQPGDRPDKAHLSTYMPVSFTDAEAAEIRSRAKQEGTSGPGYVRNLVLAVIGKRPAFNPDELVALRESNRQLSYIGRNVNQIARELHHSYQAADQLTAERLELLEKLIQSHRTTVTQVINRNWQRLGGGDE